MRQGLRGESARQLLWRALGRGAPGSTANASPVVSRLASLASKNAPGASPSASAAHDMPAHALAGPSAARCAHTAARGRFAVHPRAWRLPARVPHRRVSHRPVAAAAASSADVDDVDDVDSEASSTSAEEAGHVSDAPCKVVAEKPMVRTGCDQYRQQLKGTISAETGRTVYALAFVGSARSLRSRWCA